MQLSTLTTYFWKLNCFNQPTCDLFFLTSSLPRIQSLADSSKKILRVLQLMKSKYQFNLVYTKVFNVKDKQSIKHSTITHFCTLFDSPPSFFILRRVALLMWSNLEYRLISSKLLILALPAFVSILAAAVVQPAIAGLERHGAPGTAPSPASPRPPGCCC